MKHNKDSSNGGADQTLPRNLGAKIAKHYFRFLPDPAKLCREARWSGMTSVPDIGERIQPSADVGAGTVTTYFVDNEQKANLPTSNMGSAHAGVLPK